MPAQGQDVGWSDEDSAHVRGTGPLNQPLIVTYQADRYSSEHRTYVVLGAPRGGTSMLAGSLQLLGIPMGSVNDQHEDPAFHNESNIGGMIATIAERNRSHRFWGWKLPNTIHYFDRLARYVRNPVFMVIYRNPFDIFMSATSKSDRGLDERHFNAPAFHYARMHELIRAHATIPVHTMSYERACAAPRQFVDELAALLPLDTPAQVRGEAVAFVDGRRGYAELGRTLPDALVQPS